MLIKPIPAEYQRFDPKMLQKNMAVSMDKITGTSLIPLIKVSGGIMSRCKTARVQLLIHVKVTRMISKC